jgi:hypothetical protein
MEQGGLVGCNDAALVGTDGAVGLV